MSNSQPQGPQGQQQPQLLKPDDLAKLQCLSDDHKQKYRPVLQNFWQMMQTKPAGTPEHSQASSKLREWSSKLIVQERQYRAKIKSQSQGSQQNTAMQQPGQGQPGQQGQQASQPGSEQQQPAQQSQAAKPQGPPQSAPGLQQQPNQAQGGQLNLQQQPQPQVNPDIMKHVENFPFVLQPPPQGPMPGTPEAAAKLKESRNTYLMVLVKQEKATNKLKALTNLMAQREKNGQPVPPELVNERQKSQAEYQNAKTYIEEFRKRQQEWRAAAQGGSRVPGQQQAQPTAQQSQSQQQPAVKPEPQIKIEGGQQQQQQQQPSGQFGNMQPGGTPQNNNGMQNAQAPRQPPQQHSQQPTQFNPGQQGPPRPQINPQQANASMQQQNNSPHPHSATSNPAGPPVPLSHQAAVSAAQRSYSQSDQRTTTPLQTGQGSFHAPGSREREQLNNPKMPIPRTLNIPPPVPVSMGGGGRPTLAGPTNGAPGPMGQPVLNKFPPFQLEGEGDRVLSKRKLDELVRQVTGGTEDALTPEVEEAVLQLADEFADNVITKACKLSKLRESTSLEVRDLQVVLERNYNIRIPGYASDEVRTVRKNVPAPGWTQKMNAVQAAKVMGGKTDT